MATTELQVIIILCSIGPALSVGLDDISFYYPDFGVEGVQLVYNGSAFLNDDCSCVWLTQPVQSTSQDNYILYGGILHTPSLIFYDGSWVGAVTSGTGIFESKSVSSPETVHASFNQTIPPILNHRSPPPAPPSRPPLRPPRPLNSTGISENQPVSSREIVHASFNQTTPPILQTNNNGLLPPPAPPSPPPLPPPRPLLSTGISESQSVFSRETDSVPVDEAIPPILDIESPPPSPPIPPPPARPLDSVMSFSIYFQLSLHSRTGIASQGGGLCFLLSNSSRRYLNTSDKFSHFGVFPSLGGKTAVNTWAVEFDTHQDLVVGDIDNNHVGVNFNSAQSLKSRSLRDIGIELYSSNYSIDVWIDYNYPSQLLLVRVEKNTDSSRKRGLFHHPITPFISIPNLDMTTLIGPEMYAGFAARGTDQDHIISQWALTLSAHVPGLPTAPPEVNVTPPGVGLTSPPPPQPTLAIPGLGTQIEVGAGTLFLGWFLMLIMICLLLRCTRCGQRRLWRAYERCKLCHRFCNLRLCLYCCTLPYDANGKLRKNRGRPLKKKRLKPKTGKVRKHKAGKVRKKIAGKKRKAGKGKKRKGGEGTKRKAGEGKRRKAGDERKPQARRGEKTLAAEGKKPIAAIGKKPLAAQGKKTIAAKGKKPGAKNTRGTAQKK